MKIFRNVLLLLGAGLLAPALYFIGNSVLLVSSGSSAQGQVAEILPWGPSRSRGAPEMVVAFKTSAGDIVRFKDNADRLHSHEVGQSVEVLYDRQTPSRAVVNKFNSLWLKGYHLALIGCALLLLAYLFHKGATHATRTCAAPP